MQFHKIIIVNADIFYSLALWKFNIYKYIIVRHLKTDILHIESIERISMNPFSQAKRSQPSLFRTNPWQIKQIKLLLAGATSSECT